MSLPPFVLLRPAALVVAGIYEQLANTWFPPPHRVISITQTAKTLGAVKRVQLKQTATATTARRFSVSVTAVRQSDNPRVFFRRVGCSTPAHASMTVSSLESCSLGVGRSRTRTP